MSLVRGEIVGKKMPALTRAVPGTSLGDGLFVRKLPPREKQLWNKIVGENNGEPDNGDARLFVLVACDENGNRIFTDADAGYFGDEAGHADAMQIALEEAHDLNRVTRETIDAAKKNSSTTENESPPSSSPAN